MARTGHQGHRPAERTAARERQGGHPLLLGQPRSGRFDRPDELVFDRASNPHLAFGAGVHKCLGLHFARIQLAIAFEELLRQAT